MKGDLITHSGGVLLLGVHNLYDEDGDSKPSMYCCSSADYTLGINELPMLNAVVGQGDPISGSTATQKDSDGSLDMLIQQGMSRRTMDSKLLRCTLYEANSGTVEKYAVFRGYIVSVTELIKTGNASMRSIRIMCLGIGALLHTAPIACYRQTIGSLIVNGAQGNFELPTNGAMQSGFASPFIYMEDATVDILCGEHRMDMEGKDVLTKMAFLANALVDMSKVVDGVDMNLLEELSDDTLKIKRCIFCNYTLNTSILHTATAEGSFNRFICNALMNSLQRSSILSSIVATATSSDMLLNLVPHFKYGGTADDFRMELAPSEAWNAIDILEIDDRYVVGCNTSMNHMEHLNDPEVLVVNYSEGVGSFDGIDTSGQATGSFGVYSPDPVVTEWARIRYADMEGKSTAAKEAARGYYKTRLVRGPYWLAFSHLVDTVSIDNFKIDEDEPANDNKAKGGDETIDQSDELRSVDIADMIARAMYVFYHGASDIATFQLTPDVRFGLSGLGCLENHIGKTVDIKGYRGILRQVRYAYTSGYATSNSYMIVLERVRLIDPDEPHITCDLYVKKEDTDDEDTGNNELWNDDWTSNGSITNGISNIGDAVRKVLGASTAFGSNVAQNIYSSVRAN